MGIQWFQVSQALHQAHQLLLLLQHQARLIMKSRHVGPMRSPSKYKGSQVSHARPAAPQCMLKDPSTGDQYCALSCFLGGCPPGAKCEHVGAAGICMYPQGQVSVFNAMD